VSTRVDERVTSVAPRDNCSGDLSSTIVERVVRVASRALFPAHRAERFDACAPFADNPDVGAGLYVAGIGRCAVRSGSCVASVRDRAICIGPRVVRAAELIIAIDGRAARRGRCAVFVGDCATRVGPCVARVDHRVVFVGD